MLIQILANFITSLFFAMMFNINGKRLIYAACTGAIGGTILYLLTSNHINKIEALFVATLIISILSEIIARKTKSPVIFYLLPSLIPLVPGAGMYYTMLNVVKEDYDMALNVGLNTLLEVSSIVIASTIISSFIKIIIYYKNRKIRKV